jgi:hypothetical protein
MLLAPSQEVRVAGAPLNRPGFDGDMETSKTRKDPVHGCSPVSTPMNSASGRRGWLWGADIFYVRTF